MSWLEGELEAGVTHNEELETGVSSLSSELVRVKGRVNEMGS